MKTMINGLADRLEHISATIERLGSERGRDCAADCGCSCGGSKRTSALMLAGDSAGVQTAIVSGSSTPGQHTDTASAANVAAAAFIDTLMKARARRSTLLPNDLLFDPAWSMLLDLYRADLRGKRLSVTAVTIGSGVPDTTALRYLRVLEERGYVKRVPDETDKRRVFVKISSRTFEAMAEYFAEVEKATFRDRLPMKTQA